MTPTQAMQPLMQQVECGYRHVEPPIANQDKVQRRLRDLKIEEAELTELLATNRALQLQYESQLIPF